MRVVPYITVIYYCLSSRICYNMIVKRTIIVEEKPKITRKGVVAKTRAAKNKQSKNWLKKSRGQGSRGARRSNG